MANLTYRGVLRAVSAASPATGVNCNTNQRQPYHPCQRPRSRAGTPRAVSKGGGFTRALGDRAPVVSRALGIHLTPRLQNDAPDILMSGAPSRTAGSAINRWLAARDNVGLPEQPVASSSDWPPLSSPTMLNDR